MIKLLNSNNAPYSLISNDNVFEIEPNPNDDTILCIIGTNRV
jgi:hypothetical protein